MTVVPGAQELSFDDPVRAAEEGGLRVLDLYCPHEDNWILIVGPA